MANTYTPIASVVLSTSQSTVTFSSIPQTFTDLVIRCSTRIIKTTSDTTTLRFNSTTTTYTATFFQASGTSTTSSRDTLDRALYSNGSSETANTFSNDEIYIPNYTLSQRHPLYSVSFKSDNSAGATLQLNAGLWNNTTAITSLSLTPYLTSYDIGSSFYLYGVKNA